MIVIRQYRILRTDIQTNKDVLYIFGDNLARIGFGGQAKEMRGEPNSFGIATKRAPTYDPEDFFYDEQPEVFDIIEEEFKRLYELLLTGKYKAVVIPRDGIGTGIANLVNNAPHLLCRIVELLERIEEL